jgi:hypothetical protein
MYLTSQHKKCNIAWHHDQSKHSMATSVNAKSEHKIATRHVTYGHFAAHVTRGPAWPGQSHLHSVRCLTVFQTFEKCLC